MNAKQLRDSILEQALKGILTSQNIDDDSAEIFLKETLQKKNQLIKEKVFKKDNDVLEIEESEIPFDIPNNWRWVRLGNLFSITSSKRVKQSSWKSEGIPFYRAREIVSFKKGEVLKDPIFITKELYDENVSISGKPEKGDILVTGVGTLGITFLVENENEFYFKDGNVVWLKNFNSVNARYIEMLFESQLLKQQISSQSQGTTVGTLTIVKAKNLLLPFPPLEEQDRILANVYRLFEKIKMYEKSYNQSIRLNEEFPNKLEKSILQYAMQGKLVPQVASDEPASLLIERIKAEKERFVKEKVIKKEKALPPITEEEIPFEVPESWEWVRLGDVSTFLSGYAYKSTAYVPESDNQIIRLGNVKNSGLKLEVKPVFISEELANDTNQFILKQDDILVTMTGTKGKRDYFYTAMVKQENIKNKNLFLNQRVGAIRTFSNELAMYLNIVLKTDIIKNVVFDKETGTANQGNIGVETIRQLIVPIPPLEEQPRIVNMIEKYVENINRLNR